MAGCALIFSLLCCALIAPIYCKPNIILLLTDDQDLTLGGMTPLPFTKELFESGGATLKNFFVNTPVCCPSRTTLLTGIYPHNWHVTSGPSCMHMGITNSRFQEATIGVQMKKLSYTTGMFGKLVNPSGMEPYCKKGSDGKFEPLPGFDDYMAMCNDNRYYKNIFTKTGGEIYTSGTSPEDYLTSIIGNSTIEFMEKALSNGEPFFAYVAPHAPHVPSTPAPWYMNNFAALKAPRTPNYNYSALDHHYVIRSQQPLTGVIANDTDALFRDRWRTLLSVDDITKAVVDTLKKHNAMDNTYIIATSDHGFNLGQFRLPSCKLQPYDNDIRVPFHIYGPKIAQGSSFDFVAGMVDVSPTILSLAEGNPLVTMDGRSFSDLLFSGDSEMGQRDTHMIEYWSLGNVIRFEHYIDMPNNTYIGARLINSTHNYLYAEFYDGENVVKFDTPFEFELFDISKDPYQMTNLYKKGDATAKAVMEELKTFIHKQVQCKGETCH